MAVASFQWRSPYCEPPILAVCSSKSADGVVSSPGFEIREPSPRFERDVVRVDFFHPSIADDFVKCCSEIFEHTLVDVLDVALGSSCPHQRRNRVDEQTKLLLAARKSYVTFVMLVQHGPLQRPIYARLQRLSCHRIRR